MPGFQDHLKITKIRYTNTSSSSFTLINRSINKKGYPNFREHSVTLAQTKLHTVRLQFTGEINNKPAM